MEKSLIIQNNSGISTHIRFDIKQFKTVRKVDKNDSLFSDPMVKKSEITDHFKLHDRTLGLGFVISQPDIYLPAFGLAKISLTAISEIWGSYNDYLYITCEGKEQIDFIDLEIEVTDSPIRFFSTMVVENDEEIAMLR